MRKFFYLFLLYAVFQFLAVDSFSQEELTIPSPNAYSIAKYGSQSPNLYNGTLSIPIPLTNLKSGDLSMDIGLSYLTGGLKVAEIPSWVGAGWTLNAGGSITRAIAGLPDEINQPNYVGFMQASVNQNSCLDIKNKVLEGTHDTEPDVFTFNFFGFSGKFYYYTSCACFKSIDQAAISIQAVYGGPASQRITGFIINDNLGYQFEFLAAEKTINYSPQEPPKFQDVATSWYLTSAVGPSGDFIRLHYSNEGQSHQEFTSYKLVKSSRNIAVQGGGGTEELKSGSSFSQGTSISVTETIYLDEIETNNARIVFNRSLTTGRGSYPNVAFQLNSIQKFVKHLNEEKIDQRIEFNYEVISGKRLFLNDLNFFGADAASSDNQTYHFEYIAPESLPDFNSLNVDHWGYYNGANNQVYGVDSYLPEELFFDPGIGEGYYVAGANRQPSMVGVAGSLLSVTYPTGLTKSFSYTQNSFSKFQDPFDFSIYPVTWSYSSSETAQQFNYTINAQQPSIPSTYTFPYAVLARYFINCSCSTDCSAPTICDNIFSAGAALGATSGSKFFGKVFPANTTISFSDLSNGQLQVIGGCSYTVDVAGTFTPIRLSNIDYAGGYVLSSITNIDNLGNSDQTFYEYTEGVGPVAEPRSSGILVTKPMTRVALAISSQRGNDFRPSEIANSGIEIRESNLALPLAFEMGSPVGYSMVKERKAMDNNLMVYEFTDLVDFPDYASQSKIIVPSIVNPYDTGLTCGSIQLPGYLNASGKIVSRSMMRGKLKRQSIYGASGLLQSDSYQYTSVLESQQNLSALAVKSLGVIGDHEWVLVNNYSIESFWPQLISKISRFYQDNVAKSYQKTDYLYYNSIHKQPNMELVYYTENASPLSPDMKIVSKYAGDYLNVPGAEAPPESLVEKQIWKKVGGVSKITTSTIYKYLGNKPVEQYALTLSAPETQLNNELKSGNFYTTHLSDSRFILRTKASYYRGRQTSYQKVNELPIHYIWNETDDLNTIRAKVIGAEPKDVFLEDFESTAGNSISNSTTTAFSGARFFSGAFTKSLTGLQPGQYTLRYFEYQNSKWTLKTSAMNVPAEGNFVISISGIIDDIQFFPSKANLVTFSYDPVKGMVTQSDQNQQTYHYTYDEFKRLTETRNSANELMKKIEYHLTKF